MAEICGILSQTSLAWWSHRAALLHNGGRVSHLMISKPPPDTYVSAEASDDEKSVVAESFEGFEVSLDKGDYRFSETGVTL
jgi:hypothetical protein